VLPGIEGRFAGVVGVRRNREAYFSHFGGLERISAGKVRNPHFRIGKIDGFGPNLGVCCLYIPQIHIQASLPEKETN